MADHSTDGLISRREVLKRVGVAGAAAAVPIDALAQATREPLETLTRPKPTRSRPSPRG